MEKIVYLLWKPSGLPDAAFAAALLEDVAPRFVRLGASGVVANVVDDAATAVAKARISRLDPPLAGALSFWLDVADDRGPFEEALRAVADRLVGYLVVESVPLRNTTHAVPLGERTPGINMLACIEKPAWIDHDAWIGRWHGLHRTVALETQCTFLYVRNVVVRALTPDAPPWAGIVEEAFPTEAVTNPMLWYRADGDPEKLQAHVTRMVESCKAFLDLDRVESHPMSHYRLSILTEEPLP